MTEKIAPGAWHEGGPERDTQHVPRNQSEVDRLTSKRDNARWSAVVGFAMLFAASFSVAFAAGGVLMILYGGAGSVYWSRRIVKVKGDPWKFDPELDGPDAPDWARK